MAVFGGEEPEGQGVVFGKTGTVKPNPYLALAMRSTRESENVASGAHVHFGRLDVAFRCQKVSIRQSSLDLSQTLRHQFDHHAVHDMARSHTLRYPK